MFPPLLWSDPVGVRAATVRRCAPQCCVCVCACVRMRVCVCVRDCVRVRVRVRHLGNEGRLVLSNSLLLLFCRFLLRLLTHYLEVVLLLNNLFDGSPFQNLVRLFHAFLGSPGFLLLALVVRNSLRVTCVLENRNSIFFCDFVVFANISGVSKKSVFWGGKGHNRDQGDDLDTRH